MNEQLQTLYANNWTNLSNDLNGILKNPTYKQKPTNPLLISIDESKYKKSDLKVMILGQETNDWGNDFSDNISETIDIYDDFYNSGYAMTKYGGHFWNGINRFSNLLEKKFLQKNVYYIWNNVVKIGASGRDQNHPQDYIHKAELDNFRVLEKEVEILKPDVILFISGPNYDTNISKMLPGVKFKSLNSTFSSRQISKLEYKNLDNVFRTYHPNYLWRNNIDKYFQEIIDNINL